MRSQPFILFYLRFWYWDWLGQWLSPRIRNPDCLYLGFNLDVLEENVFAPFEEMHNVDIVLDTGNNSDRLARLQAEGEKHRYRCGAFCHTFHAYSQSKRLAPALQPRHARKP